MAQLFPEPTPLEAVASIDRLAEDACQKIAAAAKMRDWRVVDYWRAELARLRNLRATFLSGQ